MSFQTIKKPQAERDIEECFVYIAEDNLDIGVYFLVAVEETIEIIGKNPFIGKIRESKNSELTNLRMFPVKGFQKYQIFYAIQTEMIEIVRVLHGARNIPDIFG